MYTVKCGKPLMGLTMRHQYRQYISRSSKCFDSKKDKHFVKKTVCPVLLNLLSVTLK